MKLLTVKCDLDCSEFWGTGLGAFDGNCGSFQSLGRLDPFPDTDAINCTCYFHSIVIATGKPGEPNLLVKENEARHAQLLALVAFPGVVVNGMLEC
jgi:hypothetical protein